MAEARSKPNLDKLSAPAKSYLIIYNSLETLGWSLLLFNFIKFCASRDVNLYQTIKYPLLISQSAAVLEIVHVYGGFVYADPLSTCMQVVLRLFMTWGVLANFSAAQTCFGFSIVALTWSVTETIRYAFYTLNLIDAVPYFLKWLRYSTFIILYPLGAFGELLCLYEAQHAIFASGYLNIYLTNYTKFSFNVHYISAIMLLYVAPIFLHLYKHMHKQRKRALG